MVVVRVYFMDNVGYKAFGIDESTNAEKLKSMVTEKLGMKEHSSFAIFEKKEGWERCLEAQEKPCELMGQWGNAKSGGETLKDAQCAFILKKKIFLRDDEKEMSDASAKHQVYLQALWSVIESEYPCSIEDAIRLGGLQVQIVYGDHKPGSHTTGFLTQNLKNFVPTDLYALKRPQEWESLIFKAHALNTGKTADDAKSEYLDIVKQWPFYGTTFYPPCRSVNNRKLPNKIIIGVNAEGILLLKRDKELVSTHPFTEICSWASSSTTFAFEFGTQVESQKYTFETKQGAIIAASIQTYIDILVQMLKSGEESEDEDQD